MTRARRRKRDLDSAELALLREHNRLDLALYAWAIERFEQEIAALGAGFPDELERFRARNELYSRTVGRAYGVLPVVRRGLTRVGLLR